MPRSNGHSPEGANGHERPQVPKLSNKVRTRGDTVKKDQHCNSTKGGVGLPPHDGSGPRSKDPPSIVQRTDALLLGLSLIMEHHNAREKALYELNIQVHSYLDDSMSEMVWLKRCKYLLCYPLARYLRNVPPPPPDRVFSPTGALRGWFKARLNAFNNKNTHLWYSWFQAKRATIPLSDDMVEATYKTHLETLTKEDPCSDTTYDEDLDDHPNSYYLDQIMSEPTFRKVLDHVRHKVTKDYYYYKGGFDGHRKKCSIDDFPKKSACFERTRGQGGQLTELRRACGLHSDDKSCLEIVSPILWDMAFFTKIYTREGIMYNRTISRYGAYGESEWQSIPDLFPAFYDDAPLDCTIQAVLEPNKIRVISKGNALPYYMCKSLQRVLHTVLKKMSCFRLIGRPLCPTDIKDLLIKSDKDWQWNSIDYSAATDGLSYKYSKRIFESVTCNLDDDLLRVARKVLGPHNLHYPTGPGAIEFRGLQKNGQLMGSILSFPILCLANLGVYLYSTRKMREGFTYQETLNHVLINGDDMLYSGPKEVFEKNIKYGRAVGLEMSVGKAYQHHAYLNINSQSIVCDLRSEQRHIRPINFLNVGLFFGLHKVQGKIEPLEEDTTMSLFNRSAITAESHLDIPIKEGVVPNLNLLLEGSLPGCEVDLLKKSLEVNHDKIQKECSSKTFRGDYHYRNLFLPVQLGGMGVRAPAGWRYRISKNDLYVAHGYLNKYPGLCYSSQYPLPGYNVETYDTYVEKPWAPRPTPEPEKERVPFKRISFKKLKWYCLSPCFTAYVDSRHHPISTLEHSLGHSLKDSLGSPDAMLLDAPVCDLY